MTEKPKTQYRRVYWGVVILIVICGIAVYLFASLQSTAIDFVRFLFGNNGPHPTGYAQSVEHEGYYYRLQSTYLHGDERVEFDIVVGCNVRITRYKGGDSSFDALRHPNFFVKETKDGGAVLQKVTSACGGETTKNGLVPKDFLPGAVWFDDKNDLTFGTAYILEDAFDSPQAKLKFLGASIRKATKEEWDAFQPMLEKNLLDPLPYTYLGLRRLPSKEEVLAALSDKSLAKKWQNLISCTGVARYRLSDPKAREIVRRYWPKDRPRFWMSKELRDPYSVLGTTPEGLMIDGRPAAEFASQDEIYRGFPTRVRGGSFRSGKPWSKLPPEVFPMRSSAGLKWVTPDQGSQPIYQDIDFAGGKTKGTLYCWASSGITIAFPRILFERVYTRVDGERIVGEAEDDWNPAERPYIFYENDEYFYRRFDVGLY